MRAATMLAPVIAAERRAIELPRRRLEISRERLLDSLELTDGEILDDLLYPAARRTAARPADPARNGRGTRSVRSH